MEEYCATCKNIKCRCRDCFALIDNNNSWYCDEYEKNCKDVDVCMLYYEDSICVTDNYIGA